MKADAPGMEIVEPWVTIDEARRGLQQLPPPYLLRKYDATPEGYELLVDEDLRCELLDGVLIVHSPATLDHEDLISFVNTLLRSFVAKGKRGRVFGSNAVMQFGERRFCPDLSVLTTANYGRIRGGRVMGPMDLAVEVLSKSTRDYDLREKRVAYQEGHIPEIWLIDYERREFHVDWLEASAPLSSKSGRETAEPRRGPYQTELLRDGRWSSRVLPGFWIDLSWLWTMPLPDPQACLQMIG